MVMVVINLLDCLTDKTFLKFSCFMILAKYLLARRDSPEIKMVFSATIHFLEFKPLLLKMAFLFTKTFYFHLHLQHRCF